jgi:glutathione S-transferase
MMRSIENVTREPFLGGADLHVADIKIYMAVRWFKSGMLDHVPATIFDPFPNLNRIHDAVRDHAGASLTTFECSEVPCWARRANRGTRRG